MRPIKTWASDDRGSATIEFLIAGVLLLVPIMYLVIALSTVQNGSLGAESTARFVARTLAAGDEVPPELVRDIVADSYGIDPATLDVNISCTPATTQCPASGATIVVTVRSSVALPLMPAAFGIADHLAVPISGTATYRVERLSS